MRKWNFFVAKRANVCWNCIGSLVVLVVALIVTNLFKFADEAAHEKRTKTTA